jgi:hypothetical protein
MWTTLLLLAVVVVKDIQAEVMVDQMVQAQVGYAQQ